MFKNVVVAGCGQMGLGIVECAAKAGYSVLAAKLTPGDLSKPKNKLLKSLDKQVDRGKLSQQEKENILTKVDFTTDLTKISDADLVIESSIEDLELKRKVLQNLEQNMKPTACLVTNTSSIQLDDLANSLSRANAFLGLHFFNPVPMMKLVELSYLEQVNSDLVAECHAFCEDLNKKVVETKAVPGYVVNRLLVPYLLHAIETLEEGIAKPEDIDMAMKLGCGHPMGPLALADLVGLDVIYSIAKTLHDKLQDKSRYRIPSLLRTLVYDGKLGRKSGIGIYQYN